MGNQSVISIEAVIDYIESHLDGKLELETVAEAVHYSKYHLHRLFTKTVGMTIHDYVQRRQLTEAAKLLVFSDKPIIEIAFICGYESQQSFSLAFKAMYKSPPAEYREERNFYPLQLRFILHRGTMAMEFTIQDIRLAEKKDIVDWMNLMRLVIDGYPVMDEDDYLAKLEESIDEKRALVLREGDILIGAMAFTYSSGSIEFLGVHPQYRNSGLWSYVKKKYKLNVTNFLCSERSLTCYFYCILLDVFKILFLIFIWRQISTMTVNAHGIVKCFDVFKNQFMCMCIIKDFKPVAPFSLQKCMERFYTGVIPWICFL